VKTTTAAVLTSRPTTAVSRSGWSNINAAHRVVAAGVR